MQANDLPEKYRDILAQFVENDDTAHILWLCDKGITISLGKRFLPDNVYDPLDYIRENGFITEASKDAFNVFTAHIEEGIFSKTDRNEVSADVEMRFSPDEEPILCHIFALLLRDENGRITAVHINIRAFSAREVFDRQVLSVFTSDKAPQIFGKRCRNMIDKHPDENIAFIQFDIERFKLINEKYGVETGDDLLKFINDSLEIICGEGVPYCRLTADVFMIVTTFVVEDDLLTFIHRIESMILGYKGMKYRLIFGVAIVEDRTLHSRRHGDNAAIARQNIHGNALNNIGWYNGKMKNDLRKTQTIEDDMQKALLNDEFVMFLQPKYSISSNRIIGAEALARWNHPQKGMIPPVEFIPVFEKNGFILKLDQFIWESALKKIRDLLDKGIAAVPISVNISREYIQSFDVVTYISDLVKKYDVPIKLLELEITESVDAHGVDGVVAKMKETGFTMLMDDFGSGYSSLNMLKTTQFDVLKIDREFLTEFMDSDRGRKIISHTISMSRDIGLDIIAEGVETLDQARFLEKCGCDSAQGFYFSKPISASEFEKRLIEVNK